MKMHTQQSPMGVREAAKQARRDRILNTAKSILIESGHEALSVRSLAARAGLTTPTIYNLIGNKRAVLEALAREIVEALAAAHKATLTEDPIERAEEVIDRTVSFYRSAEMYSRELQLALEAESIDDFEAHLRKRGRAVALEDCRRAVELGYLNGDIDSELLGARFATSFQHAQREWLRGQLDLNGLRRSALISCFIILLADANPTFRERLIERVQQLNSTT